MISSKTHSIIIAEYCPSTIALGPGKRFALWVQGCPFRCHHCIAPEWQSITGGSEWNIDEISEKIIHEKEITGITISGGEPFLQAEALADLLSKVRLQRPELTVICFTGFIYETMLKDSPQKCIQNFLKYIDLLIDGPYIEELDDGLGLRGSKNQNFIFLSDRLKGFDFENYKRISEIFIQEGSILFVGIPGERTRQVILQNYIEL